MSARPSPPACCGGAWISSAIPNICAGCPTRRPHKRFRSRKRNSMTSMSAADWDSRYRGTDLVWGATPNSWVEQETAGLAPGRAVDLACGEGRNSIWLAARGWQVTGVDFSAAALAKAETLARGHRPPVTVDWQCSDVTTFRSSTPVDLALLVYVQ